MSTGLHLLRSEQPKIYTVSSAECIFLNLSCHLKPASNFTCISFVLSYDLCQLLEPNWQPIVVECLDRTITSGCHNYKTPCCRNCSDISDIVQALLLQPLLLRILAISITIDCYIP